MLYTLSIDYSLLLSRRPIKYGIVNLLISLLLVYGS